nr:MAG TPA: hypothetical protein [Caudoviricetes sp.]
MQLSLLYLYSLYSYTSVSIEVSLFHHSVKLPDT